MAKPLRLPPHDCLVPVLHHYHSGQPRLADHVAPEFRRAEERLDAWPSAPWYRDEVTPEGCHEPLYARWRDPMVCAADTFRNPELRPEADCVWGPEVLEDELTKETDTFRRGYISEVFHTEWCGPRPARPPPQAERASHAAAATAAVLL